METQSEAERPIHTVNDLSRAIKELRVYGDQAPSKIQVPLAEFVMFHPEMYEQVKSCYITVFNHFQITNDPFLEVFTFLDHMHHANDEEVCAVLAAYNNLPVLEYFYKRGYAWDERTLCNAVFSHSLSCLKFALEKQCPVKTLTYNKLLHLISVYGTEEMMNFVLNKQ